MQQVDGRVRRVHGDVARDVEERFRVVEDDADARIDEVVGHLLRRAGRDGEHGINIAAVFDSSPTMIGADIGGINVEDEGRLKDVVRDKNIVVGVLAVPAGSAQKVADDLVDAGVRIIFNYSEALLDVPGDVTVHTSNPAVELLHALYFHLA